MGPTLPQGFDTRNRGRKRRNERKGKPGSGSMFVIVGSYPPDRDQPRARRNMGPRNHIQEKSLRSRIERQKTVASVDEGALKPLPSLVFLLSDQFEPVGVHLTFIHPLTLILRVVPKLHLKLLEFLFLLLFYLVLPFAFQSLSFNAFDVFGRLMAMRPQESFEVRNSFRWALVLRRSEG